MGVREEDAKAEQHRAAMMTVASWRGMTNTGERGGWFSSAVQTMSEYVMFKSCLPVGSVHSASASLPSEINFALL